MLHRIALVGLSCLLSACLLDTTQPRMSSDYAARVQRAGIVSLLEPSARVSFLTSSALESHFGRLRLPGWNSERLAFDALGSRLARMGFTVSELDAGTSLDRRDIAAGIYALGEREGLDLVVVVMPDNRADFVTDTNQNVSGYGIQQAFDTAPYVYAAVSVAAYDIGKRFTVAQADGHQHEPAAAGAWDPAWQTARGELSPAPAVAEALAPQLERLLGTALAVAAQEAGL